MNGRFEPLVRCPGRGGRRCDDEALVAPGSLCRTCKGERKWPNPKRSMRAN